MQQIQFRRDIHALGAPKKPGLSAGQMIALGFGAVILLGAALLYLPAAQQPGVRLSFVDALFMSTSAVCITGLAVADVAETFSVFGRAVLLVLIQAGGLGITSVGVGIIMLTGKKINLRERMLVREALNYPTFKGVLALMKTVLAVTFAIELAGTLLCLPVFLKDRAFWPAFGTSLFHAVAAFNNSGLDILGGGASLLPYIHHPYMNLITCALIMLGGLGFFVMQELAVKKSLRRLSLHSRVVLTCNAVLWIAGALLIKAAQGGQITWLGAFFTSVSARTAGFATFPISGFSTGALAVLLLLMFVGASPGSTGGGIKTTTFFVMLRTLRAAPHKGQPTAFGKRLPRDLADKALTIVLLGLALVTAVTFALCLLEPRLGFEDVLFEAMSAFGTVGLSTGITGGLCPASKLVLSVTMLIGRLGPLSVAALWGGAPPAQVRRAEESLSIG